MVQFAFIFHMLLHIAGPFIIAALFFRKNFLRAGLLILAGILIDVDHLLANPILDPNRCSVGFHLLHSYWLLPLYVILALVPKTRLVGIGLVFHIVIDWLECVI